MSNYVYTCSGDDWGVGGGGGGQVKGHKKMHPISHSLNQGPSKLEGKMQR